MSVNLRKQTFTQLNIEMGAEGLEPSRPCDQRIFLPL
jgi:hypothetical protein